MDEQELLQTIEDLRARVARLEAEMRAMRSSRSLEIPQDYSIEIRGRLRVRADELVIESKSSLDIMAGTEIREEAANVRAIGNAEVQIKGGVVKIN